MRVFKDFVEARNEISRDLNELGTTVFAGYQSMDVDPEQFTTKELMNYDYRVLVPSNFDLNPTQPWVRKEWEERLQGILGRPINPGEAYKLRPEVWEPLLISPGATVGERFSYTYSQRFADVPFPSLYRLLRDNPNTRQAYISIWNPADVFNSNTYRVPCTLGYHLIYRGDKLNITYHMRSTDFSTHWDNDIWLAMALLYHVCEQVDMEPGHFTHVISSLHTYAADVAGVF